MSDKHIMDEVGPVEFFSELVAMYGLKRSAELSGYAILWGVADLKDKAEIIEWMKKRGVSHMSAYRVVGDFTQLLNHLEEQHSWRGTLPQLLSEMRGLAY